MVSDAVVASVPAPDAGLVWDEWLLRYHDELWARLRAHPGVARHLLEHPSVASGASLRRHTVEMLVGAGFDERTALLGASTFHTHLLGRLAIEALGPHTDRDDEPSWREHGLTGDDYVRFGLTTVLTGLRAQLVTSRPDR
jgi:hypothetical protein